ncbi:uncharacterized protein LOC143291019 [Babylonia areolata]|uniref:uncharacterized protein LOC143291019 n=1 Tax=Babylonia areolata TaxID=304850 RepID=UPI003FD465F9
MTCNRKYLISLTASTRGKDKGTGVEDDNDADVLKGQEPEVTAVSEPPEVEKKPRKEIVKKARRPISPPGAKRRQRTPSPPPPPREPTPAPIPTPPPSPPPVEEVPLPEVPLPDISLPDLPEWKEAEKAEKPKKQKFMVAPPPALKEVPKRRKPPPKIRKPLKVPIHRLKTKPAEAPVNPDQVHDMQDPLDWLAKYCIINPDRLPLYEMIFESVIADQVPRYSKPSHPSVNQVLKEAQEAGDQEEEEEEGEHGEAEGEGGKEGKSKKTKKGKKKNREGSKERGEGDGGEKSVNQLVFLEKSLTRPKLGLTLPEQQLEKLVYTLDTLHHKLEGLGSELSTLEDRRTRQVAERARELFPEVASRDYAPKTKKKGKKSKNKPVTPAVRLKPEDITDQVILTRLDDKMLSAIRQEPEVRQTELEMERAREKMSDVTERLEELASEKLLTDAFCMNHYFLRQGLNHKSPAFRRQQSELFNRLHPDPDYEMNLEELEDALQHINGHLLTQKEFFFLYSVLNLPARTTINFRLFSVVAALSEKVTQLDPVIRKLINNTDYNALDIKMEKCRELFRFVEEEDVAPRGSATADRLAVELTAGGLTPEHTRFVLSKFNRECKGLVDFLDFVTYIPLFILIHRRIISHPLREELDL